MLFDVRNEFLEHFFDVRFSDFVDRRLIGSIFVIDISPAGDQKTADRKPRQ